MSDTTGQTKLPLSRKMLDSRCAAQHYGAWAIESKWFQAALASVRAGTLKPDPQVFYDDEDEDASCDKLYNVKDGIAVICIDGQMTKRGSSFGGCSTVRVRQAIRAAAEDWMVKGIILHICTPGGTVAGTSDLADDVLSVREGTIGTGKPVVAYIADMGCSAGYWVASQCERIVSNKTAVIGSIGTYTVLEDDTKWQEEMGIKWRVVSTGPYKGLGADGAVTDVLVADVQREVDEINAPFLAAVAAGRGDRLPDITAVSDGRAHVAAQALQLGLIDEVASLDVTMQAMTDEVQSMTAEQFRQHAAENPEAAEVKDLTAKGHKAGKAEGVSEERARASGILDAHGLKDHPASVSLGAGHDVETAQTIANVAAKAKTDAEATAKAQADAAKAENDRLKQELAKKEFEAGGQRGVVTGGKGGEQKEGAKTEADFEDVKDPKSRAKAEYAANVGDCQNDFVNEGAYVGFRTAQLNSNVKMHRPAAAAK